MSQQMTTIIGGFVQLPDGTYIIGELKNVDGGREQIITYESQSPPPNMTINKHIQERIEEVARQKLSSKYPFLFFGAQDIARIARKKFKQKPNKMHLSLVFASLATKIAAFFNEHPELLFEFPLYLEYIAKNNLDPSTYLVENFIDDIVTGMSACMDNIPDGDSL